MPVVAEPESDDRDQPQSRKHRRRQLDREPLDERDLVPRPEHDVAKPADASTATTPTPPASNAVRRLDIRPFANGATAISAAPSRRAPTSAQAAHAGIESPPRTGRSPNSHGSQCDREEAGGEQEVERSPVDQEADRREHRDDHGDARYDGVDHEPRLR